MSDIYFIRHAQAGSRDNYDVLSDLGHEQAGLLGEHLQGRRVKLSAIFSGTMRRQRATAEIVREHLGSGENGVPEISAAEEWNEFSLGAIYKCLLPRLVEDSAEFARDYEDMQKALEREPHAVGGAVRKCDLAVISAWKERRFADYDGESWEDFKARITSCVNCLTAHDGDGAVAVFTSATPIAILTGIAMGLNDEAILDVGGVLYNSGITTMRLRNGRLRLFTLNATPHLPDLKRTFR